MLNFLGDRQVEVAYADLKNSIYNRPYAILIDHKWQCVVLTIRGTLSLEDLMVDANVEAVRPTLFHILSNLHALKILATNTRISMC